MKKEKKVKIETLGRITVVPYKTGVPGGFGLDITLPLGLHIMARIGADGTLSGLKVTGGRGGDTVQMFMTPYAVGGIQASQTEVTTHFLDVSDWAAAGYMSYLAHTPSRLRVRVSGYPREILVRIAPGGHGIRIDGQAGDANEFGVHWS